MKSKMQVFYRLAQLRETGCSVQEESFQDYSRSLVFEDTHQIRETKTASSTYRSQNQCHVSFHHMTCVLSYSTPAAQ